MKCEVRNLETSESFVIPADGAVFGRQGGPANITVPDQSVSKRHARVFSKDGQWFVEDLKSVNGTVVNNRRLSEPVPLTTGLIFSLSKHAFEVVVAEGQNAGGQSRSAGPRANDRSPDRNADRGQDRDSRGPQQNGDRRDAAPASQRPRPRAAESRAADDEPMLPPDPSYREERSERGDRDRRDAREPRGGRDERRPQAGPRDYDDDDQGGGGGGDPYLDNAGDDGGGAEGGAKAVLTALPRAIAYYMAALPLMALNPIGVVRRGVEEPKLKAMGPIELIAFILPVQLIAGLIGSWAAGIAMLVSGGGFSITSFFPIVGLIIAVIVSAICGFITHPLLKFVIERLLKGETDDVTRTNYMIMTQSAVGLLAVPSAVASILGAVVGKLATKFAPIYLLNLIPALIMAVATPLIAYIFWMWLKKWNVVKWAQTVGLVLLVLSALAGVARAAGVVVDAVRMTINGVGSSGGGGAGGSVELPALSAEQQKALEEAKAAAIKAGVTEEQWEAGQKAAADAQRAALAAAQPTAAPGGAPEDPKPVERDPKTAPAGDPKAADPAPAAATAAPVAAPPAPAPAAAVAGTDPVVASPTPTSAAKGAYGEYKRKRDAVEKAIADDPTLLVSNAAIAGLYRDLSRNTVAAIERANEDVKSKERNELRYYLERYREARIYEGTRATVDKLYGLMFRR